MPKTPFFSFPLYAKSQNYKYINRYTLGKMENLEQQIKEQYEKIGDRTWKCSECSRKINRDTMNPFLLSMCQKCQNGMCGL